MSSKLVCASDNNSFVGLEPEEGCYDSTRHKTLPCLHEYVEMHGQVNTHPVVVSPWSVAGNNPLHGLGSQQPQRKDHKGFMKSDVQHVTAQISSYCDESLESHRLLER